MEDSMREFAEVFGLDSTESEEQLEDENVEGTDEAEETEDDSEETVEESDESEESEEEEDSDSNEEASNKSRSQQNFAFAKLRSENKELNKVLRDVGQILGLDSGADSSKILDGVKQAVLQQKAKDQGVPVETLQKIAELENLVEENRRIKLEKDTSERFTELIDEFNLSEEQVNAFTSYLIENNLNPLEGIPVDLKAEYLKLHWSEMLKAAKDEAVQSEVKRREKAAKHSGGGVPSKKGDASNPGDYEISSVKELDAFFNKRDL